MEERGALSAARAADSDQGQMVWQVRPAWRQGRSSRYLLGDSRIGISKVQTGKGSNGRIMAGCNRSSPSHYTPQGRDPARPTCQCHGNAGDQADSLELEGGGLMYGRIIKALIKPIICLDRPNRAFYNLKTQASPKLKASPRLDRGACGWQGRAGFGQLAGAKHKGSKGG